MQKLFLFFLVLIGIWYVRRLAQRADAEPAPSEPRATEARSETVRECRHCGVLVPESEGLVVGGEFYCSSEHVRDAGARS